MANETPSWKLLVEQASAEELKDIYEGIMKPQDLPSTEGKFVVRLYDGMDREWCDVSKPAPFRKALRVWFEKTEGGSKKTSFNDLDYFRIFSAETTMAYADGRGRSDE